jgi:hypothetical protein
VRDLFKVKRLKARVFREYNDPTLQDDRGLAANVDKTVSVPWDTFSRSMFDPALRAFPFQVGQEFILHTLSRVGAIFAMKMSIAKIETVKVPYGR